MTTKNVWVRRAKALRNEAEEVENRMLHIDERNPEFIFLAKKALDLRKRVAEEEKAARLTHMLRTKPLMSRKKGRRPKTLQRNKFLCELATKYRETGAEYIAAIAIEKHQKQVSELWGHSGEKARKKILNHIRNFQPFS